MPLRRLLEVEPPDPLRYFIGVAIMMAGVVFPIGYMMFRSKRVRSSSASLYKQTSRVCSDCGGMRVSPVNIRLPRLCEHADEQHVISAV
ncbi:hypothetical protein KSP40_PGU020920 [Platanthera guangdongensis]|uniref:Uncharacterized protein n=1 Tax=Platanthera guangdongensis TaxID=2320717 RepID=A0ABR2LPK8_9ASPA